MLMPLSILHCNTWECTDFGDLTRQSGALDGNGCASRTRGIISGGNLAPQTNSSTNIIDYITIASTGDATNFGDLTLARQQAGALSNQTRGIFAGGYTPVSCQYN